jgi:hypothetical protein
MSSDPQSAQVSASNLEVRDAAGERGTVNGSPVTIGFPKGRAIRLTFFSIHCDGFPHPFGDFRFISRLTDAISGQDSGAGEIEVCRGVQQLEHQSLGMHKKGAIPELFQKIS